MNKSSNWLSIVIVAVVGVLLIVWHNETDLFNWLVRALGLTLIVPAIYVLISSLNVLKPKKELDRKDEEEKPITFSRRSAAVSLIIVACATIIFGLWMLIQPGSFIGFITYLFAAALLIFGIYQMAIVAYFARPIVMPWFFYVIPGLFIAIGLAIIFTPLHEVQATITLLTGILLVAGAVNAIVQRIAYSSLRKKMMAEDTKQIESPAKETEENAD